MKKIPLSRNKFALVSDCDYDYLIQWNWYAHNGHASNLWYARNCTFELKRRRVFMHTVVAERMGLKDKIDHIDRDGLNNQRSNLRLAKVHNPKNRKKGTNNKSGYKGVHWRADRQHWSAVITVDKRSIYLGSSHDPKTAAHMYNKAALKYHGKFASLNKV